MLRQKTRTHLQIGLNQINHENWNKNQLKILKVTNYAALIVVMIGDVFFVFLEVQSDFIFYVE